MSNILLQIKYKFHSSAAEYQDLCLSVADSFAAVPGLHWKIWILNERKNEAGGVYLFESERALADFLSSPLVARIKGHPDLYDLSASFSDVMADVTAITRGPVPAMARSVG